jgi:hypothetical protein
LPIGRAQFISPVDPAQHLRPFAGGYVQRLKLGIHQLAVIDQDINLIRAKSGIFEECSRNGHQLGIRFRGVDTNQVDVPLEELPAPALLRALITPEWPPGPPAQRESQLPLPLGDHPRQ